VQAAALLLAGILLSGAAPVSRLDVTVDKLRSGKGTLRICLTADPTRFPSCIGDANAVRLNVPAADGRFTLTGLRHDTYALAVIHDENGNHQLDKIAGIPREGFGFSRDPAVRFGPPRFAAARFAVAGEVATERVKMKYIL
jgi:uncharacterized protein (DUF2141 family)